MGSSSQAAPPAFALRSLAQRRRCAAAIFLRAEAERVRLPEGFEGAAEPLAAPGEPSSLFKSDSRRSMRSLIVAARR